MNSETSPELPRWLYVGLPAILLILPYILNAYFPDAAHVYLAKESGVVENLTVVLLFIAIVYSIKSIRADVKAQLDPKVYSLLRTWLVLFTLGCVYYLGEEISYGQHLFNWGTPEAWQTVNDQQETNLHNTYGIFDQVPRAIVTFAIIVGGVFYPLFLASGRLPAAQNPVVDWVMPTRTLVPASLTVLIISVHDKIPGLFGLEVPDFFDFKDGEVKELLIAMVFMLYIMALFARLSRTTEQAG